MGLLSDCNLTCLAIVFETSPRYIPNMKKYLIPALALICLNSVPAFSDETQSNTLSYDAKHKMCLERIADDADLAFEEAMIWQGDGGGRRARHCVAMALFALGHPGEAAVRMEKLAKSPDGGSPAMRAGYYAEAVDLWLSAEAPRRAYDAASAGLKIAKADIDLRLARARVYAALGRWDYAETDLTSALAFKPDDAQSLRYRADARLRQGKLVQAQADIQRAMIFDGDNVDVLVVRGKIIEALRVEKLAHK